jgi:predicted nucleic acid-binding Zn ribbon protein
MRRDEIAARVDELAREHEGPAFVAAVEGLSVGLDQESRDLLGAVLMERARALEGAADERARAKGWLRRTLAINTRLHRDEADRRDR